MKFVGGRFLHYFTQTSSRYIFHAIVRVYFSFDKLLPTQTVLPVHRLNDDVNDTDTSIVSLETEYSLTIITRLTRISRHFHGSHNRGKFVLIGTQLSARSERAESIPKTKSRFASKFESRGLFVESSTKRSIFADRSDTRCRREKKFTLIRTRAFKISRRRKNSGHSNKFQWRKISTGSPRSIASERSSASKVSGRKMETRGTNLNRASVR